MRALALMVMLAAVGASAQATAPRSTIDGFALQQYEPSYAGDRFFAAPDAAVEGHLRPAVRLALNYGYQPLRAINAQTGAPIPGGEIVREQLFFHLDASLALVDRVRLDVSLPVSAHVAGDALAPRTEAMHSGSLGDFRLGARLGIFGRPDDKVAVGAQTDVWLPTGTQADFAGDGNARFRVQVMASGKLSSWIYYSAAIGAQLRPYRDLGLGQVSSAFTYSAAAGVQLLGGKLQVGPELFGSASATAAPLEAMVGASYAISSFTLGAGAAMGLTRAAGTPTARAIATVAWTPRSSK